MAAGPACGRWSGTGRRSRHFEGTVAVTSQDGGRLARQAHDKLRTAIDAASAVGRNIPASISPPSQCRGPAGLFLREAATADLVVLGARHRRTRDRMAVWLNHLLPPYPQPSPGDRGARAHS